MTTITYVKLYYACTTFSVKEHNCCNVLCWGNVNLVRMLPDRLQHLTILISIDSQVGFQDAFMLTLKIYK